MITIEKIEQLDDINSTKSNLVACNNWSHDYPYAPVVSFKIAVYNEYLCIKYDVKEECTMALTDKDQGPVWTDSCVEFFISPDRSGYYNFEFNCIGKMVLGFHKSKPDNTPADEKILKTIKRKTSLEVKTFAEIIGQNHWTIEINIPISALFMHKYKSWSEIEDPTINLYKCGDNLSKPHFLSWQPIKTEKPNFHCPEFFTHVKFK